ncbi:glycosyl hydrolase family 18 protein [uncultured Clostridium sp.]|jgi:chitinase|uniref:glycoside hydrolase family 18 protein n=1 Tax=uncultured Clostridium sp. TaxID=59620 RepID=UPI0026322DFE|nr:glycosyl hydrolase family 18 protein [uncultured Clostridium sp.]
MKKHLSKGFALSFLVLTLIISFFSQPIRALEKPKEYRSVGYVFQRGSDIDKIDVTKITHLNYSFGLIYNNEYQGINPDTGKIYGTSKNPDARTPEPVPKGKLHTIYLPEKVHLDLSRVNELKAKNPDLKVLLSVGGWDARGFSDMAATEEAREAFAKSCRDVIDTYKLDGIDLDWEYPVNGGWGAIKSQPEDKTNFTLMLKEVRAAIGDDKLLTIAGSANFSFTTDWTEFKAVVDILDYINIMTYDFQYDSNYFGSAINKSEKWTPNNTDGYWVDKGVQRYVEAGCPPEKINVGIAFAAPIPAVVASSNKYKEIETKLTEVNFYESKDRVLKKVTNLLEDKNGFKKNWDEKAGSSYITTEIDGKDEFVLSYIDEKGISAKTNYVKENNLGGTMFWEFGADYDNSLVTQLASDLELDGNGEEDQDTVADISDNSFVLIILSSSIALIAILAVVLIKKKKEKE